MIVCSVEFLNFHIKSKSFKKCCVLAFSLWKIVFCYLYRLSQSLTTHQGCMVKFGLTRHFDKLFFIRSCCLLRKLYSRGVAELSEMSKLSNSIARECSVPVVQWSWLEEFYKTNMWEAAAGRRQGGLWLVESGSRDPRLVSDWSSRGRGARTFISP